MELGLHVTLFPTGIQQTDCTVTWKVCRVFNYVLLPSPFPPQTYPRRTAPHLPRSRSPSLRRIAMTMKHICWQPLRNQTSLEDRSVGLWLQGKGERQQRRKGGGWVGDGKKRNEWKKIGVKRGERMKSGRVRWDKKGKEAKRWREKREPVNEAVW